MAMSIIPRGERGRLYFQTADHWVPTFVQAAGGRGAGEAHQIAAIEAAQLARHCPALVAKDGAR